MERMHEIMRERLDADQTLYNCRKAHQDIIDRLNKEIANVGPIKIGDIVGVTGYSHRGKKMIVDELWTSTDWEGIGVKAKGRVLKKNGTPGVVTADYFIEVGVAS